MPIDPKIHYASIDELSLDPYKPSLGPQQCGRAVTQARVLELMTTWNLKRNGHLFLESGFWP